MKNSFIPIVIEDTEKNADILKRKLVVSEEGNVNISTQGNAKTNIFGKKIMKVTKQPMIIQVLSVVSVMFSVEASLNERNIWIQNM